ncbi:MAG: S26 family signal peptidase [Nanoarchaeota archaeon]|nr:S26 family signal peptidase [Nanoarchaeota archaeon]
MKRGVSVSFVVICSILIIAILLSGCSNNQITGNTIVAPESVVFSAEKECCNYKLLDNSVTLENVTVAKALGSSMRPTIQTGDTMLIKPYSKDTPLREGMIVSYKTGGQDQIHRIDGLYVDFFMAKGDNSETAEKVLYSAINGVVVGVLFNK